MTHLALTVLGTAALTVGLALLTDKGDPRPLFVVAFTCLLALGAMETRWVQTHTPIGRPLGVRLHELREAGHALYFNADLTDDEKRKQAIEWEKKVWKTVESGLHEKGMAIHREQGDLTPAMTRMNLDVALLQRVVMLDGLIRSS